MSTQATDIRARRFDTILETIGGTPLVRIRKLAPSHVNLYAKIESFNPMGSVKDRLALGIIEDAERSGQLKPGQTVIEATSGNTGIGLAMVCAAKGYPLVVVMAESFSVERRKLMRFLGAKVVLTPAAMKGSGMLAKATELAEQHGWFLCRQFENEANAEMHSRTTAPEILSAMQGEKIDYFVTGYGTGGTLKGVARVLKKQQPGIQIIACEPDNAQILGSGIPQARNADGSPTASHALFRPHAMQGWTPDFIPQLTEDAVKEKYIDRVIPINGNDALRLSRDLARREGIFVGITAGATLAGALRVAIDAPKGANIVCMLPDTGERYLSTPLFAEIPADMTDEEQLISRSTPNFRFDVSTAPAPAAASSSPPPAILPSAREFVEQAIADAKQPVVMFAFEWCEFCWSVRKMFAQLGIAYRSVDVDSVEYQKDNRGGNIRLALADRTHVATIPQIFVGGEFIGGCTDAFDAYKSGRLQGLLNKAGVKFDEALKMDPTSLLPAWLHPR
ncbi:MAG TPA: cysteine synthase A [Steroidobacteraceae bacterium]|nr:cysteine synthase A [Steroidobacteraceae bacterium]